MDFSSLNKQERQHLKIYTGFLSASKYAVILVAITLGLMAIFLT